VLESEVVLKLAQTVRAELERQGLRVVQTRLGNENLSFDDRSAVANGQRSAVFISLHIGSTGRVGTARAYYYVPPRVLPAAAAQGAGLAAWDHAQEPYAELSRRMAELAQVELAQKFSGSPEVPAAAAVRQLRTVAGPAIAIEISSVSVADGKVFEPMAPVLAEAVARAAAAFRQVYEAGAP
jgi:N-acetylmuramoyl-L-alanine amidase